MIDRGPRDGSIRDGVTAIDLIVVGALLAQPLPNAPAWDTTAQRITAIYVHGLAGPGRAPQPSPARD